MTLWIGDALGPVERACLRSVVRQGHDLAIYVYAVPRGLPRCIEVRDAASILPKPTWLDAKGGGAAIFSDWFRCALLSRGLGTWVDTDIYLLAPLEGRGPYLFGEQAPGLINNAILRLPGDSPLVRDLLRAFADGKLPPWLPWRAYLPAKLRALAGGTVNLARLPWGSTGPHALTWLARTHGVSREAVPPDIFYPVPWQQADWIRDPRKPLGEMISERTVAVHLWNECIKGFKEEPAPEGSFLKRLQEEGATED